MYFPRLEYHSLRKVIQKCNIRNKEFIQVPSVLFCLALQCFYIEIVLDIASM